MMDKITNSQVFQVCNETVTVAPDSNLRLMLGRTFELLPWRDYWISINWSDPRFLSVEKWREDIFLTNIRRYNQLENVIEYSHIGNFLYYFEVNNFIRYWPTLRGFCPQRLFRSRKTLDALWTVSFSPFLFMVPPLPSFFELTELERKVLIYVCNHPRITAEKLHYESKRDINLIESILKHLVELKYLIEIDGGYARSDYFATYQVKRPRRKVTYTVKGVTKTIITSRDW